MEDDHADVLTGAAERRLILVIVLEDFQEQMLVPTSHMWRFDRKHLNAYGSFYTKGQGSHLKILPKKSKKGSTPAGSIMFDDALNDGASEKPKRISIKMSPKQRRH